MNITRELMKKYYLTCPKCGKQGTITENAGNKKVEACKGCGHVWTVKDIMTAKESK